MWYQQTSRDNSEPFVAACLPMAPKAGGLSNLQIANPMCDAVWSADLGIEWGSGYKADYRNQHPERLQISNSP